MNIPISHCSYPHIIVHIPISHCPHCHIRLLATICLYIAYPHHLLHLLLLLPPSSPLLTSMPQSAMSDTSSKKCNPEIELRNSWFIWQPDSVKHQHNTVCLVTQCTSTVSVVRVMMMMMMMMGSLCCCIVVLCILKEWHRLQKCSNGNTTTSH